MLKKILLVFLILCWFAAPVFADSGGLSEVDAHKVWPQKANWVGQKAVFYMPKIYAKVSFIFVYDDPLKPAWGSDQRALTRKIASQNFVIKGLFRLTENKETKYYWYLVNESGGTNVWVQDYDYKPLADMPFSLPEEIAQDVKEKDSLQSLIGSTVWYNRNSSVLGEAADHLEEMTLADILSQGPFSDIYSVMLKREDGTVIEWKSGFTTNPPVYSHHDLGKVLKESFYFKSPYDTYPKWNQYDWTMIKNREVHEGWTKAKVTMSWGSPNEIKKLDYWEQWSYNDKKHKNVIFLFKQDTLEKILVPKQQKEGTVAETDVNHNQKKLENKKKTTNDRFENYEEIAVISK